MKDGLVPHVCSQGVAWDSGLFWESVRSHEVPAYVVDFPSLSTVPSTEYRDGYAQIIFKKECI